MGYETLRYEQADHVVTLTYDRPSDSPAPCPTRRMRPERRRVVTVVSVGLLATSGVSAPPQGPPTCSWQLDHDQVV